MTLECGSDPTMIRVEGKEVEFPQIAMNLQGQ